MSVFSRALRTRRLVRFAAGVLGVAWLALVAAYGYAASTVTPATASIVAAAAAFLIAGAGILYAWREPGR